MLISVNNIMKYEFMSPCWGQLGEEELEVLEN